MAKIGHFEILELVGRGAMGAVYRAVDPVIGRLVAIKVIRLMGYNDGDEAAFLKERLFKEARAAGGLSHPGIVTVYQLGTQDDEAYIVMEYIDGSTLEKRLPTGTPADPLLRSRVLLDVAAALDYAHQRGIVHRDIKPANIMLTGPADGCPSAVKITDFGIAKTLLGHTVTQTGVILGTPFYMSPEQVRGAPLDGCSDQFALAVIAYQMLTGRRPFEGEHVTSICYQIVHAEPQPLAVINPALPPAVSLVLKRALEKDSAKRFPTCAEFAEALVHSCDHRIAKTAAGPALRSNVTATTPLPAFAPVAPPTSVPPRKSPPQLAMALAAIAAIAVIAGGAWSFRPRLTEPAATDVKAAAAPASPQTLEQDSVPTASTGRVIWTGQAKRGTLLRIEGGASSSGKVYGQLPGEPIEVHVFPAERAVRRLTVFTADERYARPVRAFTAAGSAVFLWDPRHIMDLTLWESPGPANGWRRLVLRVNSSQLTACVIEWNRT